MSYNNDEQARRAQAAQNAQWASNRSQPQNTYPYQTGTYSNPDEPIIHTVQEPSMSLLNSPSSHSIPGLPHNPAPLPRRYQNPARQQDLRRTALANEARNQGQSSRGPQDAGYSAQTSSYYGQASQDPRRGPSGSSREPQDVGYSAQTSSYYGKASQDPRRGLSGSSRVPQDASYSGQPSRYYGQAPQDPRSGPSGSSQGYPGAGSSAQSSNYYPQAPQTTGSEPIGSQIAETRTNEQMPNPANYQPISSRREQEREEERISNERCPRDNRPVAPGKKHCRECLEKFGETTKSSRQRAKDEGKCFRCKKAVVVPPEKACQACRDRERTYASKSGRK